ncbi:N-acetyldiaminopimelate deacetylase [Bacillus mojavensis]|uniref:N-acetyldiaminopimelate deacetylase n=1 Tax=Bacillus mojavensis TaxID=72360 RepID=UPI002DBCB375|nr:N-acetyldiaminopimelate deacetylase [Bacillus mojavensis]MEC1615674.1 N-acetyldiaminopimelate deacetylase [Bacillus mojavensis]MEC1622614.1 N-acetyldiaminopimelate deacetylase [Bacillus mojavensis]MEC1660048.1 N-acetyldiaminopimelate deacetylase [Bacillus mojavensis]MEC1683034.1 N-acetyldiaminopimelate deacetylase [Bacillus mojavensis]MEC1690428.1 N-acetyldiaminopimelate deacetylase [Bacillus mojavensis]
MKKEELIAIRRDLHRIPELGYQEFKTQQYLLNVLEQYPKDRIEIEKWRTGLFVKVNGTAPEKMLGYRADIDALSIEEQTGLPFASEHHGKMHACGHDLHMTIALGIIDHFVHQPVKQDLLFLFQPAEEGPGGAEPMLESDVLKKWQPDLITALHIAPELPVGTIATKSGLLFANTSELVIDLEGKGGHAAYPHLAEDMVVAASTLVTQLQTIISRNTDPLDSAVITIGTITGGSAQNIIAQTAHLEGTIRTLSEESMKQVKERIEDLVKGIEIGFRCKGKVTYPSVYHQVYNTSGLTEEFMSFVAEHKLAQVIEAKEAMTGEDFGYMLKKYPGFMFWLGADSAHGLHHAKLNPDENAIETAVNVMTGYFSVYAN